MKTLKPLFLLATLFVLASTGCKKNGSTPSTITANVTFKFNGSSKKYTMVNAAYYKSVNPSSIQIIGSEGTQGLNLSITDPKIGTFNLLDNSVLATYSTSSDINNTYIGTSGKVVITTFTADAITGTFEFSGNNGLNQAGAITEGSFSAKFITE